MYCSLSYMHAHSHSLQISGLAAKLTEQLQQKGKELTQFREKHGIKFREEKGRETEKSGADSSKSQGVLVDT